MLLKEAKRVLKKNGYMLIENEGDGRKVYYDSSFTHYDYTLEDAVEEYCEANGREVPDVDSDEYQEIVDDIKYDDWVRFRDDTKDLNFGPCLVYQPTKYGNGPVEDGMIVDIDNGEELLKCASDDEDVLVYIDPEFGLTMITFSGNYRTKNVIVRITDKGKEIMDDYAEEQGGYTRDFYNDYDLLTMIRDTEGATEKIWSL